MKIVHIGWYLREPVEGVGKTILEQARALSDAGVDVELWHIGANCESPTKQDVEEKFSVWGLPAGKSSISRHLKLPKVTREWIASRKGEVSLFHLHSVFSSNNIHISRLGIPYVITPNGGWSDRVMNGSNKLLKRLWVMLYERPMWRNASFIQGVSREEIRQLTKRRFIAPIHYIPNGTHLPRCVADLDKEGYMLYIGRYDISQKGLDVLLESIKILHQQKKKFPKLVMAGPDYRGGRSFLESYIEENHLGECIELLGPVQAEQKENLFLNARLFIHTSRWEGLPLVLLEALSYGVPCLLTPGTNVATEWSESGAAFEVAFDSAMIATEIERLIHLDLRAAASAARKLAENDYSWQAIGRGLIELYKNSLDKSSS